MWTFLISSARQRSWFARAHDEVWRRCRPVEGGFGMEEERKPQDEGADTEG
jgi:hypothetical protein